MDWIASGIGLKIVGYMLLASVGYMLVVLSLTLSCRISAVRESSVARLFLAALLPAALFDLFIYTALIRNWDAVQFLTSSIQLLPFCFAGAVPAMLISAPWFRRLTLGKDWAQIWCAAIVGGILLAILACLALTAMGELIQYL